MNCPKCGDDLMANAYACRCGWKGQAPRVFTRTEHRPYNPDDPAILAAKARCMAEMARFGKTPPSRDWAHKIIQRRDDGEVIPPAVLAKALVATGGA